MIFYKIGNQLFATQAEAKAVSKDFEQIDVPSTSKAELQKYLQDLLDQINPVQEPLKVQDLQPVFVPPPPLPSYTEISVKIDEVFENLPIKQQLHYAAIAMENARSRIS